ncbi:MAG: hypothetical protein D6675_05560 [Gemmatimonadetes bacterium]|nr:MAG: hypothetical protein D6675_05560 [Gemmatimonadota bacterium]
MKAYHTRITGAVLFLFLALQVASCWNPFSPQQDKPEKIRPLAPNTPENVLSNLVLAYRQRDIELYLDCLADDFEFYLLDEDWADFDGDGETDQFWGLALEEQFTRNMFEQAWRIELDDFRGTQSITDPSDPSGKSKILKRSFTLRVWETEESVDPLPAQGEATFTLRPNEQGIWKIVKWVDESEV